MPQPFHLLKDEFNFPISFRGSSMRDSLGSAMFD